MITIRLSMNGESPMTSPVRGLRSGAPGIAVSNATATITVSAPHIAYRRPRASSAGPTSGASSIGSPWPAPATAGS